MHKMNKNYVFIEKWINKNKKFIKYMSKFDDLKSKEE